MQLLRLLENQMYLLNSLTWVSTSTRITVIIVITVTYSLHFIRLSYALDLSKVSYLEVTLMKTMVHFSRLENKMDAYLKLFTMLIALLAIIS